MDRREWTEFHKIESMKCGSVWMLDGNFKMPYGRF